MPSLLPNVAIWQIYFDQYSKSKLDGNFIQYNNTSVTIFFENKIIIDIWENQKEIWEKSDYVGVLSWRFGQKTSIKSSDIISQINLSNIKKDVYSLNPSTYKNVPSHYMHPGFGHTINICRIIDRYNMLPFKLEGFDSSNKCKIFCNYWICKPEIFEDYVKNYLNPLCNWLLTCNDPDLLLELSTLINYRGQLYPIHPFILEGLFECYVSHKEYSYNYINSTETKISNISSPSSFLSEQNKVKN